MPDHNPEGREPRDDTDAENAAFTPPPAPLPDDSRLAEPDWEGASGYLAPDLETVADPGLPGGPRLMVWLLLLLGIGAFSLIFQLQEAAILVVLAGLFVAAQAADLYPGHAWLYRVVAWIVPVGGAGLFGALAFAISGGEPSAGQMFMVALSAASALACLMTSFRLFSDAITRTLFRGEEPSHALRLASRLVLICFMIALPGWYAFRDQFETLLADPGAMFNHGFLGTGLVGYILLAFAAVGYLVRRNLPDALERLGVRPLRPVDYLIVPLGVLLMFALNVALEAVQRIWFTDLWLSDQRVTQLIASGLTLSQVIMLGLSAGIGEEITLRGALQPRLGLVLTSLLFAALHVQYSWFGMAVIFIFGIVLGLIRIRTSTTVVMAIHTLYDMAAVFTMPQPT